MELEAVQAELRVRSPAEAADLGVLLLKRLARPALLAWLVFVLPLQLMVIGLCLFWAARGGPEGWAFLALWWLKPVYDRAFGVVLGQGLFAEAPTGLALLRALWSHGWRGLVGDLLWRRFSIARSTVAPVNLLEHLSGSAAAQRRKVLVHGQGSYLTTILTGCSMIEWACYAGLVVGANWMMPGDNGWSPFDLFDEDSRATSTYWTLATYVLSLGVAEAIFVAMGFGLYINRRTTIEGWDVELAFRRMATRLSNGPNAGAAPLILLLACVPWVAPAGWPTGLAAVHAQPTQASAAGPLASYEPGYGPDAGVDDANAVGSAIWHAGGDAGENAGEAIPEDTFEFSEGAGVDGNRLQVPVVADDGGARAAMQTVLARPELKTKHVEESWELRDPDEEEDEEEDGMAPEPTGPWLAQLATAIALGVKALLWAVAVLALAGLVYVVMRAVTRPKRVGGGQQGAQQTQPPLPAATLGAARVRYLNVTETVGLARRLLADGRAEPALFALYRGGLALLAHSDGVFVSPEATEGACIRQLEAVPIPEARRTLCIDLARARQYAAYAHVAPERTQVQGLCDRFEQCFGGTE